MSALLQLEKSVTFRNILVATDFSDASRHAIQCASALVHSDDQQLFVLHAVAPEPRLPVPMDRFPKELDIDFVAAKRDLDALMASELLEPLHPKQIVKRGPVWDVVAEVVQQKKIDLLVLGTHGRRGLKKLVLGSVAEELFHGATCPVMMVGPAAIPIRPIRRVLYATDFGTASLRALPYAIDFADRNGGELILLHLVPPMPIEYIGPYWYPGTDLVEREEVSKRESIKRLRDLLPSNYGLKCAVEHVVEIHLAPEGLINFARDAHVDLIVMGVKASSANTARLTSHLPWAIAHEVVANAECPVLTIRA